jgi:hypothetical protein
VSKHGVRVPPCGVELKIEAGRQPCGVRRLDLQQQQQQQG